MTPQLPSSSLVSTRLISSFSFLNITQFISTLNDNLYKLLVSYYLIHIHGIEYASTILAFAGAVYILPFIIFARLSGAIADYFSKSRIVIITRICALIIAVAASLAFYLENSRAIYFVLFAMATNSAVFVIIRNSLLPELVPEEEISKANGLMNSFSFVAIILGTFGASFLLDMTGRSYLLASISLIFSSLIALWMSFRIEYTRPLGVHEKMKLLFLSEIVSSLKLASQYPSLLSSIIGAAFFLFFGAYFQLNLIPFAMQSLHLTDLQGGYLFLLCSIGIGTGSIVAGKISGKTVELGLVPLASLAIAFCLFFMHIYADSLISIILLIISIGFFGGLYDVPMEAYVQYKSPAQARGHIMGATKFMSSVGVLCASGMLYFITTVLGLNPSQGFLILGFILLLVSVLYSYLYRQSIKQFMTKRSEL